MRSGQVVVYLTMVLLVIAVMLFANLSSFFSIRSKNRMMNAADAAAVAAAKYQGQLINEVGWRNVEHLRAAVLGEPWTDDEGVDRTDALRSLVFLGPVECLVRANDAARDWGFEGGADAKTLRNFEDHISEILNNPDFYPQTGEENDPWPTYANRLRAAIGGNPAVLPRFMEVANPGASGLFASQAFYDVLAAEAWCWFRIGGRSAYLSMDPGQMSPPEITPAKPPENSEVFSLHLTFKGWMDSDWAEEWRGTGFSDRWTNFVCQVTGLAPEQFSPKATVLDPEQVWAFYDGNWGKWSPTFNPDNLPIAGALKPEYDVAGCVSACMMLGDIPRLGSPRLPGGGLREFKAENVDDGAERAKVRETMTVTADAKPLGTVTLPEGGVAPVTGFCGFVAPSHPDAQIFTDAQLVLVDTVPHPSGVGMEQGWYEHVRSHSPQSPAQGGCSYCALWRKWSDDSYRARIRDWLSQNAESCSPKGGGGTPQKGGYGYAH